MEKQRVRKHIYAGGRVQGVGFRYRAYYLAESMGLTGWVRNLYDGRVEMELQGTEGEIAALREKLEQGSFIRIESWVCEEIPLQKESGFRVRG